MNSGMPEGMRVAETLSLADIAQDSGLLELSSVSQWFSSGQVGLVRI